MTVPTQVAIVALLQHLVDTLNRPRILAVNPADEEKARAANAAYVAEHPDAPPVEIVPHPLVPAGQACLVEPSELERRARGSGV